ncbi:MAG: KamA family radical SAM protein [Candidatus Aureabacteria bacterium]|nr:KamA family radical SAM protein [Candidatus Auribacterota bacterium]
MRTIIDYFSKTIQESREWKDWRWQLQHRLCKKTEFEPYLKLSEDEIEGLTSKKHFITAVTPYILSLMDPNDPNCPIRKQFIPSGKEKYISPLEMSDPCGEDGHSPVPGIVHRYPDRVLFLATDICAVYCRYCTRSRLVGHNSGLHFNETVEKGLDYIRGNKKVRDVLISGGDPLLMSDERIEMILKSLREIPHVELVRIGSRIPIVLPQRITDKLCTMLEKYHPLFISVHVNNPKELTPEVKEATSKLCKAGIPLGCQSVLLRGINDSAETMKALVQKLLTFRIRPYYLYHCDLVKGTSHLRTSITKGIGIMRKLRGFTTGYAVPTYVLDAPGGGGKIPIEPNNIMSQKDGMVRLRNWAGKIYEYKEETQSSPRKNPEHVHAEEMMLSLKI